MTDKISKTLALIAHDGKKADMVAFAMRYKSVLERYHMVATSTTGELLKEKCGLDIERSRKKPFSLLTKARLISTIRLVFRARGLSSAGRAQHWQC